MAPMSLRDQHNRFGLIQEGRNAIALGGVLSIYVNEKITQLVQLMAASYRDGRAEFPVLLGHAAQITCLLDLLSDLENKARRGEAAAKQEMQDAKTP